MLPEGLPADRDDLPMHQAARTGLPVHAVDLDVIRADGTRVSLLQFAAPLLDELGHPRGAIGVFLDVSRHRRAAEAQQFLGDATHVLAGSLNVEATLARLARLAVPTMADWAVLDVRNDQGVAIRVGQAHRDPERQRVMDQRRAMNAARHHEALMPGRVLEIVANGKSRLLARVTPAALSALGYSDEQIAIAQTNGIASVMVLPLVVHGTVQGGFVWVRDERRPRFDDDDLTLADEVARRASGAIENARLYQEAQTASRLKDEFVATLSHELRTPLNALLGWIALARTGQLSPERQRDALASIERMAQLQAQITNDLMDVSKAVSGKVQLRPHEVDAAETTRHVAETLRLAAEAKGVRLTVEIPPDLPFVYADPDRLQQIVFNLVSNAVKFTAVGSIDVSARTDAGWLAIRVRDSGIGIPRAFLPHVFDRFRQGDGSVTREFGGLGLGLSIVRALVELHGGTVAAESDGPGSGSTFTVWLPVVPAAPLPTRVPAWATPNPPDRATEP
jgi:signal transduction histidine kinase